MNTTELIAILNKEFKGSIVKEPLTLSTVVPTGSMKLDKAIGVGGFPGGRISELYGIESSGKSTIALKAFANAQKMGLMPVYIDMEYAFDQDYAAMLGIDISPDNLIVSQPDSAEAALGTIETALQNGSRFIVLDSVGAMVPHRETIGEGEVGDSHVGLVARLMSQGVRRMMPLVAKKDAVVLFINQVRDKIGGMPGFGGPTTGTPGGHTIKHYYGLRIQLARSATERDGDEASAITIAAEIKKNKVAPPFVKTSFDIRFGTGVDVEDELVQICSAAGILKKSGSWWKNSEGVSVGQGIEAAKEYLRSHPEQIKTAITNFCPFIKSEFYL